MAEVIQARNLALYEVKEKLSLQQTDDPQFFSEWKNLSPQLSEQENELYQVVTILKHFRDLVLKQTWQAQHAS